MKTLSNWVDILKIVRMEICLGFCDDCHRDLWINITDFLKQLKNLSMLNIYCFYGMHRSKAGNTNIHLFVPHFIKHLEMPISDPNQIKILLERCRNLSTIILTPVLEDTTLIEKIVKWFADNTVDTTCEDAGDKVHIWLGKKKFSTEIK